jgi:hypothetical protein
LTEKSQSSEEHMRKLLSALAIATILLAGSLMSKAEAAMVTGVGTLPVQAKSYTPVETVAYRHYRRAYRRGYRRGYYGYGYPYYGYGYRPYGYYGGYRPYGYGYGWRPGFSIYIGPGWGWGY